MQNKLCGSGPGSCLVQLSPEPLPPLGVALRGGAWRGAARRGVAWHVKAWRGEAVLGRSP